MKVKLETTLKQLRAAGACTRGYMDPETRTPKREIHALATEALKC